MRSLRAWVLPAVLACITVAEGAELDAGLLPDVPSDAGLADGGVLEARWARVTFSTSVVVDTMPSVNVGVLVGRPFVSTYARRGLEADGLALVPALELLGGGVSGERCNGVTLCGGRLAGGPALDVGFVSGLEAPDGHHAFSSFHAFGVSVLVARSILEAAPLAPSGSWTELLLRARLSSEVSPPGSGVRYRGELLLDLPIGLQGAGPRTVRIGAGVGFSL
ncbi:MAG: hypothetical protein Q8N26_01650 [Myxococcales bacterium]|nr:hypothetical protein [Myxococcales bacterium]